MTTLINCTPFLEGEELAKEFGCYFFEASAKTGTNIDEAFYELVREIKRRQKVSWGGQSRRRSVLNVVVKKRNNMASLRSLQMPIMMMSSTAVVAVTDALCFEHALAPFFGKSSNNEIL